MNPKVSIIVPNYNHEKFLKQRLESVFNQTYQDFEVILLDDCSTDNSLGILKAYANHTKASHFKVNPKNSGSPFKQWQKGIRLAQGEYIWIAESDDYCELNFLETLMKPLLEDSSIDVSYCQTEDVDEKGNHVYDRIHYTKQFQPNIWEDNFTIQGNAFNLNYLLVKNVIPNASAVLFKSSKVKNIFFDGALLKMQMCGDWLFWIQLCAGNQVAFVNKHLNYFRHHDNITRTHNSLQKQKLRLQEEAILRGKAFQDLCIQDKEQETLLLKNWIDLHAFFDGFTKSFYSITLPQTSRKTLFLEFVFLTLKKRFKF